MAAQASGGDLRKAITFLQSAWTMDQKNFSEQSIIEVSGKIPKPIMVSVLESCKSNSIDQVVESIKKTCQLGYPADKILSQFFDMVVSTQIFDSSQKSRICIKISEADQNLLDGAGEFLQLLMVFSFVMKELAQVGDMDVE